MQDIIRKYYTDYFKPQWKACLFVSIFWTLISLIDNSLMRSIKIGFIILAGLFLISIIIFCGEHYRKITIIKKLNSSRYSFLHNHEFTLNYNDLSLEGHYKGYYIKIYPVSKYKRNKEFYVDVIEALYTFENFENKDEEQFEKYLTGNYFWGYLVFAHHRVGYIPKDWKNPNFEDNLNGLISILKREDLIPLDKEEWIKIYGKKIQELIEYDIKSRTKQIIKIGKILDVKYIKPERQKK